MDSSGLRFWRVLGRVYAFPITMFTLAIVPVLNYSYSGHGGISWLFAPLAFPSVILVAISKLARGSNENRTWYKKFFLISIPSYILFAYPLSWAATASIQSAFGLEVQPLSFYLIMISPFPWYYFT